MMCILAPVMKLRRLAPLALAVVFACGPSPVDEPKDDAVATLSIDPPTTELLIDNGVPAQSGFTATLTYPDGDTRDVTSEVRFSVDTGYGTFAGSTLTMTAAGKTQVFASWSEKYASAVVIARLRNVRVDPSLPAGAAGWFGNAEDPSRAPSIVYPPDGVAMPRNLGDFEVHWTDPQNDVFELSLKTEFADVRVIVPGGNGVVTSGSWTKFLAAEWLAAVGYEPSVSYRVRGVASQNPTTVGSTLPRIVKLSNEPMLGGLYYWASTAQNGGAYGIFRHDMSQPGQEAEQFYTTAQTGGRCVACHVLSRDGTRMAVTYDGGNGSATLVDVASKQTKGEVRGWNFGTFTPDGSKFMAVQDGSLAVLDADTQQPLSTMPASGAITHPDISVDGTRLVYVSKPSGGADWHFSGGKIMVRSFDTATNQFGPEQMLVSDTSNNYYPSFSPDGHWVLFNRAPGSSSYHNASASLWVIKSDGSAPAIELVAANAGVGLTNSWGRWAPFQQTMGAGNESMYWVTVSSTRDFGVRLIGANRPQIWMTPFYPQRAAAQQDPSTAAFRLPFQNIDGNNHIAQWTEQIIAPL
jgi:Tol biopolymer transport system component